MPLVIRVRLPPGTGQALKKAARKIGQAFGEALPVVVQLLPSVDGNGLRNGERLKQSQKCDGQRAARQFLDPPEFDLRNMGKRKAARHAADDRYQRLAVKARFGPAEPGCNDGGDDQGYQHVNLRQVMFSG